MRSLLYSFLGFVTLIPSFVYGQTNVYAPLVGIPGNAAGGFDQYISFLYGASISVAALLAVVKIIIAGAKYMLSDIVSSKGAAIADIQGAVLGLLLILGAVIILEFINPQLINGNIQFQSIPARPTVNAGSSVTASLNSSLQALLNAGSCGTVVDRSDTSHIVVGFDASACPNPANALGVFAQVCLREGGTQRGNPAQMTSGCSIPRTGIGAGGISPAPTEFSMSGYSLVDVNFWLVNSENIGLDEDYINNSGSTGNIVVYDAMRQCREEVSPSYQAEYGPACLESLTSLLFETCSVFEGALCNTGWCIHNAGVRSGTYGCALPYERFSASQVRNSYQANTPTSQQQANFYGRAQFEAGCSALGGRTRNINLYDEEMDNLRCVRI